VLPSSAFPSKPCCAFGRSGKVLACLICLKILPLTSAKALPKLSLPRENCCVACSRKHSSTTCFSDLENTFMFYRTLRRFPSQSQYTCGCFVRVTGGQIRGILTNGVLERTVAEVFRGGMFTMRNKASMLSIQRYE
jgi:hypothetical protein